jgi:PAS domain S-box-containing protein
MAELRSILEKLPRGANNAIGLCDSVVEDVGLLIEQHENLHSVLDKEVALRSHAQEFRRLMYEESPFSMSIATLEEGRFVDVNEAFSVRTGYSREEIVGRTSTEIGLWAEGENRQRLVDILCNEGAIDGVEIKVHSKDGGLIHGRFYARLISMGGERCILSITQNVEERHRAEQEAVRLRTFYEELLALLPAHIVMVDRDGRYEYASPSAVSDPDLRAWVIGHTLEEVCKKRGLDDEIGRRRSEWVNLVTARKEVMQFDERFVLETGEVQHWIRTHKPILDEHGETTHILIYGLDVTDLRRLEDQFRQAQKMEAVGRLAGGVAHDFNNLLTAIMGTADLMVGQANEPAAVEGSANEILHIAERGAALTRQLLAFSRRQVTSRTVLNLNHVIDGMKEMLRRLIGENINLEVELAPSLPDIYADVSQIEQVLMNLVVNARDAMPRGGTVTVSTRIAPPQFFESAAGVNGTALPRALLVVHDTGCGMPPDVLARIFEPFFTTKEEGKGTGLGLSTVYAIAQGCNGEVAVESNEGQGTVITVYFPAADRVLLKVASPSSGGKRPVGKGTVLVVEDEQSVRKVVERILSKEGYTVITAQNAHEALQRVEKEGAGIDLILTDMVMPGPSGRDLAESVRKSHPDMRILFMSGHIENRDSRFIAEQLGDRFIQKPFTADVLSARVSKLLNDG